MASEVTLPSDAEVKRADIYFDVAMEMVAARKKFKPFNSAHEGFAVLLEEVEELKAHVFQKSENRNIEEMRAEAIQVAASAFLFIQDCCDEE